MKKYILLILLVIIIFISTLFIIDEKNNELDLKINNLQINNIEIEISNKGSEDLYRNVIINQKNYINDKLLNSKFSFIILLEQKDKIQFINPNNYDINYKIILDKNLENKYEYEILSQYFKVTKDYANREFFSFYCTYSIKELRNKNNESEIYHFNGEFEIKDIL